MLPTATKKNLSLALTQCNFDYFVFSWYPSYVPNSQEELQVVQNKLIRFMLNLGPSDHVGIEQLYTLGLLNADDRAEQLRLHNAHKVFYKQATVYLMANSNNYRKTENEHTAQGIKFWPT